VSKEDEIKVIAYSIWEQEGCPNGKDCEHWLRAEAIWEEREAKQPAKKIPLQAAPSKRSIRSRHAKK
jgi:hypothetical protein